MVSFPELNVITTQVPDTFFSVFKINFSTNSVHKGYESFISLVHTSGKEIVHVHFLFEGYQAGNLGD